jgi:type II secretory pathway component PulM
VELLTKAADAASMFWQALDERERRLLLYGAVYLAVLVYASLRRRERERFRRELLAELELAADGRG